MILIINLFAIALFACWGWQHYKKQALRQFYWPALTLKLLSGILLGWLYRDYLGGGDTWSMFTAAVSMKDIIFQSPEAFISIFIKSDYTLIPNYQYTWLPSAVMVKLLAIMSWVTNSNYWLVAVYLSLFSFFGFWRFAGSLYLLSAHKWVAIAPLLFFPSLIFWTSGVLKDTLAIGSLTWLLGILLTAYLSTKISKANIIGAIFLFIVLAIFKYYLAAILLVAVITLFVGIYLSRFIRMEGLRILSYPLIFSIILLGISLLHPNLWPSRFINVIFENYQQYLIVSKNSAFISFEHLQPNVWSFFKYSPKALFGGLFMPLWLPELSIFKGIVIFENWVLLGLTIIAVTKISKPSTALQPLLFTALGYVITAAIFITFATPNYGTLVRYKTGYLVVFIPILLLTIIRRKNRAK